MRNKTGLKKSFFYLHNAIKENFFLFLLFFVPGVALSSGSAFYFIEHRRLSVSSLDVLLGILLFCQYVLYACVSGVLYRKQRSPLTLLKKALGATLRHLLSTGRFLLFIIPLWILVFYVYFTIPVFMDFSFDENLITALFTCLFLIWLFIWAILNWHSVLFPLEVEPGVKNLFKRSFKLFPVLVQFSLLCIIQTGLLLLLLYFHWPWLSLILFVIAVYYDALLIVSLLITFHEFDIPEDFMNEDDYN